MTDSPLRESDSDRRERRQRGSRRQTFGFVLLALGIGAATCGRVQVPADVAAYGRTSYEIGAYSVPCILIIAGILSIIRGRSWMR